MITWVQVWVIRSWVLKTGLVHHVSDICGCIIRRTIGRRLRSWVHGGSSLGYLARTVGLWAGTTDRSITNRSTGHTLIQPGCSNDLAFAL